MNISINLIKISDEEPSENQACLFVPAEAPNMLISGVYDHYSCTFYGNGYSYDADNVIGWCSNNVVIAQEYLK